MSVENKRRKSHHLNKGKREEEKENSAFFEREPCPAAELCYSQSVPSSRILTDFAEFEFIAKGAFGAVFKVSHIYSRASPRAREGFVNHASFANAPSSTIIVSF